MKIILVLLALAIGVTIYVLLPTDEGLERVYVALDGHRADTISALDDSAALIKFFDGLKPVAKKKQEIGELRSQREKLENEAKRLRNDPDIDSTEAKRGLEEMESRYYLLKRDAEDLRARLREMKKYKEILDPLTAVNGRLQGSLVKLSATNTDPEFLEQANKLIDDSRIARSLAMKGMQSLSVSIVDGRGYCEAARRELEKLNRDMAELEARGTR